MKVAIIGSRTVKNSKVVLKKMLEELPEECTEIVSGGAPGVDKLAEEFARSKNLKLTIISNDDAFIKSRMISEYADSLILGLFIKRHGGNYFIMHKTFKACQDHNNK